jgi:hypothetical protein
LTQSISFFILLILFAFKLEILSFELPKEESDVPSYSSSRSGVYGIIPRIKQLMHNAFQFKKWPNQGSALVIRYSLTHHSKDVNQAAQPDKNILAAALYDYGVHILNKKSVNVIRITFIATADNMKGQGYGSLIVKHFKVLQAMWNNQQVSKLYLYF